MTQYTLWPFCGGETHKTFSTQTLCTDAVCSLQ
jgi:hypothetical protein